MSEADDIHERLDELPSLQMLLDTAKSERTLTTASEETGGLESISNDLPQDCRPQTLKLIPFGVRLEGSWTGFQAEATLELHPDIEGWPSHLVIDDELLDLGRQQRHAFQQIGTALAGLRDVSSRLDRRTKKALDKLQAIENEARSVRLKIEEQQAGASSIDRRISDLTQRISVLSSLEEIHNDRRKRIRELQNHRTFLLNQIDLARQEITQHRTSMVELLNLVVSPAIRLTLEPFAQRREYLSVLAGALRGAA